MTKKPVTLENLLPYLPRYSYSVHKKQMEPITLILMGSKHQIKQSLEAAGWYMADKITVRSSLKSAWASISDRSYRRGPMWPSFINGKQNSLGFEMPTRSDTYRRRHHLRLWKTRFLAKGKPLWVGTLSYDRGIGFVKHTLIPAHHISPDLHGEEEYLARTLDLLKPLYAKLASPEKGMINTGDAYVWDGKALVLDLSDGAGLRHAA